MIELPEPGATELLHQYISRLLSTKIINQSQIIFAIQNFYKSK